jgi:PPOX class probable F420-dependent enzyme
VPEPPVPPEVDAFLRKAHPAVIGTLRTDGSPHTVATWYDWDDGRALVNMEVTRLRLTHIRRDPRVSLTALDVDDWYTHVSLLGRVVSLADDPDLVDIDRLALRYTGKPFRRRDAKRVSAWIEVDRWHAWDL